MERLMLIVQLIILVGVGVLIFFTKSYLPSYTKEKGKNLATREDIKEITDKIESVKIEHAKELEGIKSQLSAKFHGETVRFEKEFKVLEELWMRLLDLHNARRVLETEDRERFEKAHDELLRVINDHKPFFPQEVFKLLEEYQKRQYQYFKTQPDLNPTKMPAEYWDKFFNDREANLKEIDNLREKVCEAIRRSAAGRSAMTYQNEG